MRAIAFLITLGWFTVFFGSIAAWLTHVISCISHGNWAFLIAGAIAAPIGVIHGLGIWLGVW